MTFTLIGTVLVLHFIFDFVLQSNWMAQNKSKNYVALLTHCNIYAIGLIITQIHIGIAYDVSAQLVIAWAIGNWLAHLLTDAITSRISAHYWQQERKHAFFVVIGADQLIHYLTLFGTLALVL